MGLTPTFPPHCNSHRRRIFGVAPDASHRYYLCRCVFAHLTILSAMKGMALSPLFLTALLSPIHRVLLCWHAYNGRAMQTLVWTAQGRARFSHDYAGQGSSPTTVLVQGRVRGDLHSAGRGEGQGSHLQRRWRCGPMQLQSRYQVLQFSQCQMIKRRVRRNKRRGRRELRGRRKGEKEDSQ